VFNLITDKFGLIWYILMQNLGIVKEKLN